MPGIANDLNINQLGIQSFNDVNGVFTGVTITAGTGITVTNGNGQTGNPTISLTGGSVAVEHLTGDSGGQLNPDGSNNFNILGQQAGTIPVMITTGLVSTLHVEDRTWTTSLVVDPSSTLGLRGTFTTIALALTAAVSGQTIYIRPGTYTENLTLKAGVNLCSYGCNSQNSQVLIVGGATASFTGSCSLSGITLQDDGGAINPNILVTGANATIVNLLNCKIIATNGTALANQGSNASSQINVLSCNGNISGGSGTVIFQNTGIGSVNFYFSSFKNTGNSVTSNSISAGSGLIVSCEFNNGVGASVTGNLIISNSYIQNSAINAACLSVGSNAGSIVTSSNCYFESGTASSVSLTGSNATINLTNCTIKSSNTNAIVRVSSTPTIKFANLSFIGTSSLIDPLLTQVPFVNSNDAVKITSPGAYPYTTLPQDGVILVDSSSARTIVPLASPTTGQMHRIKDNVGSAAANNITITPSGKNIDGAASFVINTNYGSVDIVYNGTEWSIL